MDSHKIERVGCPEATKKGAMSEIGASDYSGGKTNGKTLLGAAELDEDGTRLKSDTDRPDIIFVESLVATLHSIVR
jgi:hypothetical protein